MNLRIYQEFFLNIHIHQIHISVSLKQVHSIQICAIKNIQILGGQSYIMYMQLTLLENLDRGLNLA